MPIVHEMSQESIYNTLYSALALTDSIFQIWITLTFAVLVATYVAERRFDPSLYRLVSWLYAFASGILCVRFGSAAYQAFHYKNLLRARGFESWPVPNIVSLIIGIGTFAFLLSGTLCTLWFVRSAGKRGKAREMAPKA
jgi:hypothetical protein